jgi:hypothetical protein
VCEATADEVLRWEVIVEEFKLRNVGGHGRRIGEECRFRMSCSWIF